MFWDVELNLAENKLYCRCYLFRNRKNDVNTDETVSSTITETINERPINFIKQTIPIPIEIESIKMRLNDKFLLK